MQDVDTVDQDGIVIDQDPAGGDRLSKGSRVTIMVGRFKPPVNAEPSPSATPSPTVTPGSTP
jgi:beta-lactam-binding protein with PASTA domain